MESKDKARELVNMYYNHSTSQAEAIRMVEGVLLTTLCQIIDSLHGHVFFRRDYDEELMKTGINNLKWWQEVAYEVQQIKMKLPV